MHSYDVHKDLCTVTLVQGVNIESSTRTFLYLTILSTVSIFIPTRKSEIKTSQFELIHDQLPLAVPCYDLFPVTDLTVVPSYEEPSGTTGSLELTGGEYKTRERIHRSLADLRLLAIPASRSRVADSYPN